MTPAHVVVGVTVVGTVNVRTVGFGAACFGFAGGAGGVGTRRVGTLPVNRRVRASLGRRGTVVVVARAARVVDVAGRVDDGAIIADGRGLGPSAAPARAATTTSAPANIATTPTTASPRTDHMEWLSVRSHHS